jgi:hypothetical protein
MRVIPAPVVRKLRRSHRGAGFPREIFPVKQCGRGAPSFLKLGLIATLRAWTKSLTIASDDGVQAKRHFLTNSRIPARRQAPTSDSGKSGFRGKHSREAVWQAASSMLFDYCDAACADGITDEWRGRASPNKGHFLTNQPGASSQCYGLRLPKIGVSRGTFSGETVWQAASSILFELSRHRVRGRNHGRVAPGDGVRTKGALLDEFARIPARRHKAPASDSGKLDGPAGRNKPEALQESERNRKEKAAALLQKSPEAAALRKSKHRRQKSRPLA